MNLDLSNQFVGSMTEYVAEDRQDQRRNREHEEGLGEPIPTSLVGQLAPIIACIALLLQCMLPGRPALSSIRGNVEDGSGVVIPGASITLHSDENKEDLRIISGASGQYELKGLKAGRYGLTVHRSGFSDAVVGSVSLDAKQELRLPITMAAQLPR
ncbi:MAG TPA: carboxypeptidase-like regulatory domain-containing protein [Terracidiphilus sp.]|nr:carboxypeptidase-like regulatory domain-containing protein [Terracidiphilus sp.]